MGTCAPETWHTLPPILVLSISSLSLSVWGNLVLFSCLRMLDIPRLGFVAGSLNAFHDPSRTSHNDHFFLTLQASMRIRHILHIGRCSRPTVHKALHSILANVSLHIKVPLLALTKFTSSRKSPFRFRLVTNSNRVEARLIYFLNQLSQIRQSQGCL